MSRFAPRQQRKDVWLNDLAFSNVDELGNRWLITDIDGWWDLPAPTMGEVDRAYSEDGSYYEPGRYQSRTLRLTGKIIPPNTETNAGNIARQRLNKQLQLVRKTGLLQVLESAELGGGKQAEVVIVARPIVESNRLNGVLEFDIQFRAPDPRKYSVDLSTTEAYLIGGEGGGRTYNLEFNRTYSGEQARNTALVINDGDYDTYGVIRIHGPIDDPGAHHLESDRHIKFPGMRLGVGQYVEINLGEKTIISESGISLRDRMDDGSRWFKFDAGETRVSLLGSQYLEYEPTVPDVTNYVTDPSFEGTADDTRARTVRRGHVSNPSGLSDQKITVLRESVFDDHQAKDSSAYTVGNVSGGYATSPRVTLAGPDGGLFPVSDDTTHHFVQMDVRPTTTRVASAELTLGSGTSGEVPLESGVWTTIRVDSFVPDQDYDITLNIPGANTTDRVQIRNIMVLRSTTPIAGDIPFWDPEPGVSYEGVATTETTDGVYQQFYSEPIGWSLPNNPESLLRTIETGDEDTDGAYLIPRSEDPHVIDFGRATTSGTDITYGVLGEGITEIRLYDSETDKLLQTSVPSHTAWNYISEEPVRPRLEATVDVMGGGSPVRRKITGAMITFDGGTTIFTDRTPNEDGYLYNYYSTFTTAREMVESFTTAEFDDEVYHPHSRTVSKRAYEGARSLEVVYPIVEEDQENVKPTPISKPSVSLSGGIYYVRAKIMANKATVVDVQVEGAESEGSTTVGVNPNHWSDVSFPVELLSSGSPFVTITPSAADRDVELYVDAVGILTDDVPYFDGSMKGPYTWSGAPHSSTSATIPVVGVPNARMEIMHRNAWIG